MKFSKTYIVIALAALFLGACAKTDSDFAQRYAKNAAGGDAINPLMAGEADQIAIAAGVNLDVINLTKSVETVTNGNQQIQQQVIQSTLIVNQREVPVTTRHAQNNFLQMTSGSLKINDVTVVFNAVCGSQECNPVYISVEAYKANSNAPVIQLGFRKYFTIQGLDRYQKFAAADAKRLIKSNSFSANDMSDTTVMVGYLNQNLATASGYVSTK